MLSKTRTPIGPAVRLTSERCTTLAPARLPRNSGRGRAERPGVDPLPKTVLPRTVVLVGLMGAGKSAIGRRLASKLNLPFVDADTEIEAAAGCTIDEIFARDGEAAFRAGERKIIARLLTEPTPHILATGGGAFMDPQTRALIRERGTSVWLRAALDVLVERTARRTHRPLLKKGDPREILGHLMEQRHPIYAEADLTVESDEHPPEYTVARVIEALENHYGHPIRQPRRGAGPEEKHPS